MIGVVRLFETAERRKKKSQVFKFSVANFGDLSFGAESLKCYFNFVFSVTAFRCFWASCSKAPQQMKEIASAKARDLSTKVESLKRYCTSSHRLCCGSALNHSATLMPALLFGRQKGNSGKLLESLCTFQTLSLLFIRDLGANRYFVPCSCVNCADNYWAEICVWEHRASSRRHSIMEPICICFH